MRGPPIAIESSMTKVAIAIVCKTPAAGMSKTRLSPPLNAEECAKISACFIADLAATIGGLADDTNVVPYALYTPVGSENELRSLLPPGFGLVLQESGDFGIKLYAGIKDLLRLGHDGVILVNSDSPTLPRQILREAVDAVRRGNDVTLSRAFDGGYTLIGLSAPHAALFDDIPWSTSNVFSATIERAQSLGLKVDVVSPWYDVDDAQSYLMLENELDGKGLPFPHQELEKDVAHKTRNFVDARRQKSQPTK